MRSLKIVLSFIIFGLIATNSYSQKTSIEELKPFTTDIFSFIEKLNQEIDSFFVKERAQKLNRKLRYFKNDLNKYLKARKDIMIYLDQNNYEIYSDKVKVKFSKLSKRLEDLTQRLYRLSLILSSRLSSDIKDVIYKIQEPLTANRIVYLTKLDELISGREVDVEKLKVEGAIILEKIEQTLALIEVIEDKLKSKFKI